MNNFKYYFLLSAALFLSSSAWAMEDEITVLGSEAGVAVHYVTDGSKLKVVRGTEECNIVSKVCGNGYGAITAVVLQPDDGVLVVSRQAGGNVGKTWAFKILCVGSLQVARVAEQQVGLKNMLIKVRSFSSKSPPSSLLFDCYDEPMVQTINYMLEGTDFHGSMKAYSLPELCALEFCSPYKDSFLKTTISRESLRGHSSPGPSVGNNTPQVPGGAMLPPSLLDPIS